MPKQPAKSTRAARSEPKSGVRRRALDTGLIEADFKRNYARFQYCLVDFLAEHLADASKTFGGDMESVVLLALLGQTHLNAVIAAEASGRDTEEIPPDRKGITTGRMADASGIPRETVRRKLNALAGRGWVSREDGFWHLSMEGQDAVARGDLAELDERGVRRTARLFALLAPLVFEREEIANGHKAPGAV